MIPCYTRVISERVREGLIIKRYINSSVYLLTCGWPPRPSFSALITSFIMHQPKPSFNNIEQCMDELVMIHHILGPFFSVSPTGVGEAVSDLEKKQNTHRCAKSLIRCSVSKPAGLR